MVKPSPPAALEMAESDLLFQLEIVSFNAPSKFCCADKMSERDVCTQCREPEFRWRILIGGATQSTAIPLELFPSRQGDRARNGS